MAKMPHEFAVIRYSPIYHCPDGTPLQLDNCGHRHRTLDSARACRQRLISKSRDWLDPDWNDSKIVDTLRWEAQQ